MITRNILRIARETPVVSSPELLIQVLNTTSVSLSADGGFTWQLTQTDSPYTLQRVAACKDYILATHYSAGNGLRIMRSVNGANWVEVTHNIPGTSAVAQANIVYNGTMFALSIASSNTSLQKFFYSLDGETWLAQVTPNRSYVSSRLSAAGNMFVICRVNTGEMIHAGTIGNAFFERAATSLGFGTTYYGVACAEYFNDHLIVFGSQGRKISTSPNGNGTFTNRLGASNNDSWAHAACNDSVICSVGATQGGTTMMYYSTDGTTWLNGSTAFSSSTDSVGSSGGANCAVRCGEHILFIGANNGIVCRTMNGVTFEKIGTTQVPWSAATLAYKPAAA